MKHLCYIATALFLLVVCATKAWAEDGVTYTQVTEQSQIVDGGEYILVVEANDRIYYAQKDFKCVEATKSKPINNPLILKFIETGSNRRFFLYDEAKYYYISSNGSIISSITNIENDNYRYWDITIATDGKLTMIAYNSNNERYGTRIMSYNGTNKIINYSTSSSGDLYLYRVTTPAQKVSVTVSELGYSTFCCDKALDFSNSSISAYTLTLNGTDIALTSITKVPANTGILLYKEGGATEDIDVCTDELEGITGNALSAVSSTYTVGDDERIYVLSAFDGVVAFYRAEAGLELPAGKAYITLPVDDGTEAKYLSFGQLLPTALTTANTPVSQRPGYNIHGQRVNSCYRGIIITDGKKRITSR